MLFNFSEKYIFFDGALGTMLQKHGLKPGEMPDLMNITAPETVENIHKSYIEAGSDIICTNTFGANALNLEKTGYAPAEIITAGVAIAKRAVSAFSSETVSSSVKVALDIGPTGTMPDFEDDDGEQHYENIYSIYKEIAVTGEKSGADLVAFETFSDIYELKTAVLAVRDNTKLPVFTTMTFDRFGYTFMGCTVDSFVRVIGSMGVAAIGVNCSLEPSQMYETTRRIFNVTRLPLIVKLNAGLPNSKSGEYSVGPDEFAKQMLPYANFGVKIIGGCCGTTPEHIRALRNVFLEG